MRSPVQRHLLNSTWHCPSGGTGTGTDPGDTPVAPRARNIWTHTGITSGNHGLRHGSALHGHHHGTGQAEDNMQSPKTAGVWQSWDTARPGYGTNLKYGTDGIQQSLGDGKASGVWHKDIWHTVRMQHGWDMAKPGYGKTRMWHRRDMAQQGCGTARQEQGLSHSVTGSTPNTPLDTPTPPSRILCSGISPPHTPSHCLQTPGNNFSPERGLWFGFCSLLAEQGLFPFP